MKNTTKELVFLRTLAVTTVLSLFIFASVAFKKSTNQKFETIDVERINIVERDGTIKMIITNVAEFPNGKDTVNHRPVNIERKKRAGMLFFNEEGIECGGLIYDGSENKNVDLTVL